MITRGERLALIFLAVAAIGIGVAIKFIGAAPPATTVRSAAGPRLFRVVNQQAFQTATQLEKLADTRDELRLVRTAQRLADNEIDLAFASALRDAKMHPPAETPAIRQIKDRLRELDAQLESDQGTVKELTAALAVAKGPRAEELNDELKLAQAEAALHEGQRNDAKLDLGRAGGDPESRIQRQFTQHESSQHGDQTQQQAQVWLSKPESYTVPSTLASQIRAWVQLRTKRSQLLDAQRQITASASDLDKKHDDLEVHIKQLTESSQAAKQAPSANNKSVLALLQHESEDRKTLAEYDQRALDLQQISQAYGDWSTLVIGRMRSCVRGALQSLLWIVLIGVAMVIGTIAVERAAVKVSSERRRLATLRLLGRFGVQAVGVVLILFVILGSPGQLSTVIALAGAGLTVALKDFIVAFFGWFVLMGKNGIRVGDWVEINGIGGEVVEIGLLRTVLLETGNWADTGHPTGRRVTFVNSFAIEGHYFNFSTTGQWLWDSIEVGIPGGQDPYAITEGIMELVTKETAQSTQQAEQEWRRATSASGVQSFAAGPGISVRPAGSGVNVTVRYITRAHERFDTRTKLYREIVELLHGSRTQSSGART